MVPDPSLGEDNESWYSYLEEPTDLGDDADYVPLEMELSAGDAEALVTNTRGILVRLIDFVREETKPYVAEHTQRVGWGLGRDDAVAVIYEALNRWPAKWNESAPAPGKSLAEAIVLALEEAVARWPSSQEVEDLCLVAERLHKEAPPAPWSFEPNGREVVADALDRGILRGFGKDVVWRAAGQFAVEARELLPKACNGQPWASR